MHAPLVQSGSATAYRPDIDGLRALAVLLVLAFHFHAPGFSGGFIGVDVFFVISGYLITRLISAEMKRGAFSFSGFYVRRVRRLAPAFLVVAAVSFMAGFLLMTPEHFSRFGGSMTAAVFSLSNFYFWRHTDYFDRAEHFQPLLHTWSLSVEEQFYLFFPLLMVLVTRLKRPWLAIAGIGILSLAASIAATRVWPSAAFYFPAYRAFEFAIGAILVWMRPAREGVSEASVIGGLAVIGYAAFTFNTFTRFPGPAALVPCVGAALCIYGGQASFAGLALRNRAAVFIGLTSYSIYLWHWPILIFYRYYIFREPTVAENAAMFAASIAMGYLSWRFVELPWRRGKLRYSNYAVLAFAAIIAFPVALAGTIVRIDDGMPWRVSDDARAMFAKNWTFAADFAGSINCGDRACDFGDLANPAITLIIGDSQVDHYTKALNRLYPGRHFKLLQSGTCFMGRDFRSRTGGWKWQHCHEIEADAKRWLRDPAVTSVIHGQRWPSYVNALERTADGKPVDFPDHATMFDAAIKDALALYDGFVGRVVIVNAVPNTNLACLTRPLYIQQECPHPPLWQFEMFAKTIAPLIAEDQRFRFVDPETVLCTGGKCISSTGGRPAYSDELHLTVQGASLVVPEIMRALQ